MFSKILVEFNGNKGWEIGYEETVSDNPVGDEAYREASRNAANLYASGCLADGYECRITYVPTNLREDS